MLNQGLTFDPVIPFLGIYSRELKKTCSHKWLYLDVQSNIIPGSQKVEIFIYQSMNEWINKMWYNHKVEYYSAVKRNEVLVHVTTWIYHENIKLGERDQTHKAVYYMAPFIWNVQNRQIFTYRKLINDCQGLGKKNCHGYKGFFLGDENVLN